jgi:hypothetical protein
MVRDHPGLPEQCDVQGMKQCLLCVVLPSLHKDRLPTLCDGGTRPMESMAW